MSHGIETFCGNTVLILGTFDALLFTAAFCANNEIHQQTVNFSHAGWRAPRLFSCVYIYTHIYTGDYIH